MMKYTRRFEDVDSAIAYVEAIMEWMETKYFPGVQAEYQSDRWNWRNVCGRAGQIREILGYEVDFPYDIMNAWWIHTPAFRIQRVSLAQYSTSEYTTEVSVALVDEYLAVEMRLLFS
jgi:hypothetical protein